MKYFRYIVRSNKTSLHFIAKILSKDRLTVKIKMVKVFVNVTNDYYKINNVYIFNNPFNDDLRKKCVRKISNHVGKMFYRKYCK